MKLSILVIFVALAIVPPVNAFDQKQVAKNCLTQATAALSRKDYRKALPYLEQAANLDPGNAEVQFCMGKTNFCLDRKADAIKNFAQGLRLDPECKVEAYYKLMGHALVLEDRPKEAIEIFSKGIAKIPGNAELYCERGCTYALLDHFDQGVVDLSAAIKINPGSWHYFRERAMIYRGLHQYTNAIKDYTSEISIAPKAPVPYADRALVYKAMGKLDLAAKDMATSQRLMKLDPESTK
jgi:tetratricopeptide (TPR) repeat protein